MTRQKHLEAIIAKCRESLAIAEQRTQGKWIHDKSRETIGDVTTEDLDNIAQTQERIDVQNNGGRVANNIQRDLNAAYIAACAGPAEAGWRATIAAIEGLQECYANASREEDCSRAYDALNQIIAAWPEELL